MITLKVLQAAPVGSRAVFDFGHGVKTVLHKVTATTWEYGKVDKILPGYQVSAEALANGHKDRPVTIHQPAPVRIHQWRVDRKGPWWFTRYCRLCGDFDMFEADGNAAHTDARNHARTHAQAHVA